MRKPRVPSECCSSFSRSRSKTSEPFDPLISKPSAFLRPVANRVAPIVPIAPPSKSATASNASSTSRPSKNVRVGGGDGGDLADEVAREVDHVGAQVAERARSRILGMEAPRVVGGRAPFLQVGAAEVVDLAELACLDQLACQADRGHEAVVERRHVLHAGRARPRCQIS